MKKILAVLLFSVFFAGTFVQAQNPKLPSADAALKQSVAVAKAKDKTVFVLFHASWCGWCKRLEKAMESPELKGIFEKNYVITRIDVLERGTKVDSLENPGGKEFLKKIGGEKSGLPFFVFFDKKGKQIADSKIIKGENIGYPGAPEEIDAFVALLKKTGKHFSSADLATVADYFKKNAPKS